MRDLFFGRSRYGEFLTAGEGIPTNVLAERLRRLQAAELIEKTGARPHGAHRLTPKGRALGPILRALEAWGGKFVQGTRRRKKAQSTAEYGRFAHRHRMTAGLMPRDDARVVPDRRN